MNSELTRIMDELKDLNIVVTTLKRLESKIPEEVTERVFELLSRIQHYD